MRAIMVMFDTLNRRMLPPYGCDWTIAPNFARLAARSVTFDNCWVGSMPCMPARRELHTGRHNFLHRGWGPLEPFDDSMPQLLKEAGVYAHLCTDHQHYWEDGGATYHQRYNSFEFLRGQEGDAWKGHVRDPEAANHIGGAWRQDVVNRQYMKEEAQQPQAKTFRAGLEFIETNQAEDKWFLQIETFDPHEPFFTQRRWKDLYPHDYDGPQFDWPPYREVRESPEEVAHVRYEYAALLSMCDAHLGDVLDAMDRHEMWDDTMLIVCTDHGFLLGEHDLWAKCHAPFYNEVAHNPLFVWDPRSGVAGERRDQLVQMIDYPATLLEFFDVPRPADMQGIPLRDCIATNAPTRDAAIFGIFGGHVNVTDGRYVYMRGPQGERNGPLDMYTLMPTNMRNRFAPKLLQDMELASGFPFLKGCQVLKIDASGLRDRTLDTALYDIQADYNQATALADPEAEAKMCAHLSAVMTANDAPPEQWQRLGLPVPE